MERFIEFEEVVSANDLQQVLADGNPGIMILRFSKLTGTVKVRIDRRLSKNALKRAFHPHRIKRIYNQFPLQNKRLGT